MPRLITCFLIISTGLFSVAQEPLLHSKKLYVSPDGKLYVQKDQPIYLWLSSSSSEKSTKYRLWSEASKEYSNPMYLDVDGYNSIRSPSAVDTVTKKTIVPLQDIVFEVYADGIAPITNIDYGDTKLFKANNKLHTGSGTIITLSAKDELSGIDNIYYSVNASPYLPYSQAIILNEENEYHLKYYAVDNVGNVEAVQEVIVVYDKSSPVTQLIVEGDRFENVLSGRSKIVLNAEDKVTGIKAVYYTIDSGSEKAYTTLILAANLSQDEHTLTYFAMDQVGNKEPMQNFTFYVDKTPPTIIEEVLGKSFFSGGKEFSSGKSRLKLTSFDNKAGVKEVRYSVNNGEYQLYESPVFLTQSAGDLLIKSYAVDQVNNHSNSQTANDKTSIPYIDLTGPELDYAFEGPQFQSRDTLFVNRNTKIRLLATDYEAGMNRIEYSINGSNPVEYSGPYSIENEGYNTIDFTGFDNVDNTSGGSFGVKIDNTGPSIGFTFGTTILRKEADMDVYPNHTVLFLSASDRVVGFMRMTYKLNGSAPVEYLGIIKNLPKGKNVIVINAFDKLGNSSEQIINFAIE
jgi:hypothetical protein